MNFISFMTIFNTLMLLVVLGAMSGYYEDEDRLDRVFSFMFSITIHMLSVGFFVWLFVR